MSTTAVPLRPIGKGALAMLWLGLAVAIGLAAAWAYTATRIDQVRVEAISAGNGPAPTADGFAVVKIEGRLADGTVFQPEAEGPVRLAEMIPGFSRGLQMMRQGGRYRLFVPAALGYGAEAQGPIPPNSDLIFTVEVKEVQTAEQMQQMMAQQQMIEQMMREQGGAAGAGGPPGGGAGAPPGGGAGAPPGASGGR